MIYLSNYLALYLSTDLPTYLPAYLLTYRSIGLCTCVRVCVYTWCIYFPIYLSIDLHVLYIQRTQFELCMCLVFCLWFWWLLCMCIHLHMFLHICQTHMHTYVHTYIHTCLSVAIHIGVYVLFHGCIWLRMDSTAPVRRCTGAHVQLCLAFRRTTSLRTWGSRVGVRCSLIGFRV